MSHRLNLRPYASRRVWIPRFNLETNIKFIQEYRKHPCLWDPKDIQYMKHAPRYRAYEEISDAMNYPGLDPASVRAKIKIMRSCYISSRKQIASKAGTSTPHKPVDWFWAADSFLHDVIRLGFAEPACIQEEYRYLKERYEVPAANASATEAEVYFESDLPGLSSVEVIKAVNDDEDEGETVKAELIEEMQLADDNIYLELDNDQLVAMEGSYKFKVNAEEEPSRTEDSEMEIQSHHVPYHKTKTKKSRKKDLGTEAEEAKSQKSGEESEDDEFDAFGKCVALQLKTLPIDGALELESQIHTLITKKRMALLKKNKFQ